MWFAGLGSGFRALGDTLWIEGLGRGVRVSGRTLRRFCRVNFAPCGNICEKALAFSCDVDSVERNALRGGAAGGTSSRYADAVQGSGGCGCA